MRTTKMSLANIKGKLSRAEMKQIMAGSGTDCNTYICYTTSDCTASKCGNACNSYNGHNVCWWNPFG